MLAWLKVPANISDYRQMCEESVKIPLLVTHFNIFEFRGKLSLSNSHLHGPSLAQQNVVFLHSEMII